MTFLAAALIGTCCALAVGWVTGNLPERRVTERERPGVSPGALWLRQAGLGITPLQFWAASAAAGMVAFVVLSTITGTPLVAFVPALGAAVIPRGWFGRRRTQRLRQLQEAWPDGLRDLLASIAAGRSLPHALESLVATGPEALRDAFARYPMLARMVGPAAALDIVREELADPTSDRVLEVLILAHERGGRIVRSVLEDLVVSTTRDLKVAEELETDALETKINTRVVLVLPWLVLVALTARPGPFRDFYGSTGGLLVVLGGCVLSGLGFLWVRRLGRVDVEPRVLGSAAPVTVR